MKLTDQQWKEKLSQEEYRVCRQKGTERPYSGTLLHNEESGEYRCKCCNAVLFDAQDKFDSGCGWPSFSAQSEHENVVFAEDFSHGMHRIEILCKHCDAHLGHVFEDGPAPTGQRFCVNSVSLNFDPKS